VRFRWLHGRLALPGARTEGSMKQLLASLGPFMGVRARPAVAAILLGIAGMCACIAPVAAQTDDAQLQQGDDESGPSAPPAPVIAVRLGFNGVAKVGDWLPVAVQVSNDGAGVSGELQIQIDDSA